jgi:hypothetical protein
MRKKYLLTSVVMMMALLSILAGVSFAAEAVVEKENVPGVVLKR